MSKRSGGQSVPNIEGLKYGMLGDFSKVGEFVAPQARGASAAGASPARAEGASGEPRRREPGDRFLSIYLSIYITYICS